MGVGEEKRGGPPGCRSTREDGHVLRTLDRVGGREAHSAMVFDSSRVWPSRSFTMTTLTAHDSLTVHMS